MLPLCAYVVYLLGNSYQQDGNRELVALISCVRSAATVQSAWLYNLVGR